MRAALFLSVACLAALSAFAADEPKAPSTAPADAALEYTRDLEKRADGVLQALDLNDPARAARVREAVINQYRNLRRLHDARDANIRALKDRPDPARSELDKQVEAERARTDQAAAMLNARFLAALFSDLTPGQVETVKDTMTYNKLRVTYTAYLEMLPDLTPVQKKAIFDTLKQARDKAVYAGSAEEKSAVFDKFKGRVNNFLASEGYDLKLASKQWAERRKKQGK